MKPRIIFLVSNDISYDQRMMRICTCLAENGYEVELVGRMRKQSIPLKDKPYLQTRLSFLFDKGKLFYTELNIRFFFLLLFKKFDAVCAIDLDTLPAAAIATGLKGKKLIYDAHEYFTEVPEVIGRPIVQKLWQWIERMFVPRSHLRYTVSGTLARLFEDKYELKFELIRNLPLYDKNRKPVKKPDGIQLLYQGALNEGRGLEAMIAAMKKIDAVLIIAGDGDITEELKKQAFNLGVSHKVYFKGYVPPDELKLLTAQSHIGVNLLENKGLSYYYSLSNKFADYIHAGIPQICIDFPEYRNLNQEFDVALLINNLETSAIESAVNRLINESDLYNMLQKNCDVCAAQLNWQKESEKLLAIYDELLR